MGYSWFFYVATLNTSKLSLFVRKNCQFTVPKFCFKITWVIFKIQRKQTKCCTVCNVFFFFLHNLPSSNYELYISRVWTSHKQVTTRVANYCIQPICRNCLKLEEIRNSSLQKSAKLSWIISHGHEIKEHMVNHKLKY